MIFKSQNLREEILSHLDEKICFAAGGQCFGKSTFHIKIGDNDFRIYEQYGLAADVYLIQFTDDRKPFFIPKMVYMDSIEVHKEEIENICENLILYQKEFKIKKQKENLESDFVEGKTYDN